MAPGGPPLILASSSAARHAVLTAAGVRFRAVSPDIDEAVIKAAMRAEGESAEAAALALADAKAASVPDPAALVIGADQILVCDGEWYDKPRDLAAAHSHLLALRGRTHTLVTAVSCWMGGRPLWSHTAQPSLTMRACSEPFLQAYVASEGAALLGCVGAYRLEGLGVQLFDRIDGEHTAILGLPLLPLLAFLRERGVVAT